MIRFFVNKYPAVFVLCFLIFILGAIAYRSLPREAAPEVKVPLIFVTSTYLGVSAKDMETLVTQPIEDEIEGLEGLTKITSTSEQGLSSIAVEFAPNTEVEVALRRVKERVDVAKGDLPGDVDNPYVRELNFSDQPVLIVVLSHAAGLEILNQTIDFLEEEIKRVHGVLDVKISGKLEKELAIEVDPLALKLYGLAFEDISKAVRNENITIPGGILKSRSKNYSLSVSGEIKDVKTFEDIVVTGNEQKVRLKDIATVSLKYKDRETIARLNGKPSVSLAVTKRPGENIVEMVEGIKGLIEENKYRYPSGTQIDYSFDDSRTVKFMIEDLENNIFSGLVLVLAVTLLFLGFTNSIFVSLAIPFSMLISFFVIQLMDITLNMMVLFSLILALGMLVDNGIVIVENIFRHGTLGKSRKEAAIDGTMEVAWPVATSTLTTILAFLPIIFMPGMMGDFMSYIPKTVIIVLLASLFVAVAINPVFCSRFLKISEARMKKLTEGGSFFKRVQGIYEVWLRASLRHPWQVIGLSVLLVIAGMTANAMFGKEALFFPNIDPPATIVSVEMPYGTPLHKTDSVLSIVERKIDSMPSSIEHLQATAGKSAGDLFAREQKDFHFANLRLGFKPYIEREISGLQTSLEVEEALKFFPAAEIKVTKQEGGPPTGNPISYEITGLDYPLLGKYADTLLAIINDHSDILENVDTDFEKAKPQIRVEVLREKASLLGLNTQTIANTVRNAMNGGEISKYRQGNDEYDVMIRYDERFRNSLEDLRNLEIVHEGTRIYLSSVANIYDDTDVGVVKRKNLKRTVEVWADFKPEVTGKDSAKNDIETRVAAIKPAPGVRIGKGEGEQIQEEATEFLGQAFITAIILIFIVLIIQFNSITQPMIILAAVFLSLGGIFWGFFLFQMPFVIIMSGIGTISLAGVVVNNGIVLIDFINQLRAKGLSLEDAIVEAGITRLRPVLLTAITTVLGLIPMAFGVSFDFHSFSLQMESESSEWWTYLAWAVIFGLTFATALTLVVVPVLTLADQKFRFFLRKKFSKSSKQRN